MMKRVTVLLSLLGMLSFVQAPTASAVPSNEQFVIGVSQEFDTIDPMIGSMVASTYIRLMVMRTLTTVGSDWNARCELCMKIPTFENGLAKKIIDKDGKEKILSTWEIKPNVRWGDGTPVTGHDFKFGWIVGSNENIPSPSREIYTDLEQITVDPQNPRRFTIKSKKATYLFTKIDTNYLLPQHILNKVFEAAKNTPGAYEKQTLYNVEPTNPGLYMGPYLVKEVKEGSHVILEPNPYWYGEKSKIKRIIFKVIPNTQALEANIASGQIDMISELGLTFDQALSLQKRIKPTDPYEVKIREGATYEHIDLNLDNPILKDVRVRKALMYGVDRDKLVQALFEGKQKKAIHDVHPLDLYYTEDVVLYPYDLVKAEQLVEEAGWKKGADGYRYKDGQKLTMTIMTTADNKTRELVEVFLQSEWKKMGLDLKIQNQPARVFFAETTHKRTFPHMAMYAWVSSPENPPKTSLHSTQIVSAANGWSGQNYTGWNNPKADKALDDQELSFDVNQRKKLMRDLLYEYTNDVPVIPLYYRSDNAVIPKNLKGFQITGHQFFSSQEVEKWDLGQ